MQVSKQMETVWADIEKQKNVELCFVCKLDKMQEVVMEWIAKDIYNLFINGAFISYGPARAAKGYSRVERLDITPFLTKEENIISVYVQSNYTNTLCFAKEEPLFGVRILKDNIVLKSTSDFRCFLMTDKLQKVERMSSQRGFLEVYRMDRERTYIDGTFPELNMKQVPCPKLLERHVVYAKNEKKEATLLKTATATLERPKEWSNGFTGQLETGVEIDTYPRKECECLLCQELLSLSISDEKVGDRASTLPCYVYRFPHVYCGKFMLKVHVMQPTTLWLTYDDLLVDGFVKFNREQIIHGAKWTLEPGLYNLYTQEVYSGQYIQLVIEGEAKLEEVAIITIENPEAEEKLSDNILANMPNLDEKLISIVQAARNTFAQNAYDLFTDCPSRERAGWLCDSYFMGKAEQFFTDDNKVEKNFLENYLLFKNEMFVHDGVVPMCYPSYPRRPNSYIPNWILWYVLELEDYQNRTGDTVFVEMHRQRILDILDFFAGYENEYGLLENQEGWVFVEWSRATDFVKDVNFPSNMLYADAIRAAGVLLKDESLLRKSLTLKEQIFKMSFNGEVFLDHAKRVDGALQVIDTDISELCQIFALYFQIVPKNEKCYEKLQENFKEGFRNSKYKDQICPTAMFIGGILRLMVLYDMKEYELLLNECKERFTDMAEKTGTIWEFFGENASCNHGFGSILGKIICEAAKNKSQEETLS